MHLPVPEWLIDVLLSVRNTLFDVVLVDKRPTACFTASVACVVHGAADCRGTHFELTLAGQFSPVGLLVFPIFWSQFELSD